MTVCVPVAHIFRSPDRMSEHIDEILFGEKCEILEEKGDFLKIRTDYGYEGYVSVSDLSGRPYEPDFMINVPFADLLAEPKNFFRPFLSLPSTARIKAFLPEENKRYAEVLLQDGKKYYIHKNLITPLNKERLPEKALREKLVSDARDYMKAPYRWGGRTFSGIDCSGLCFTVYRKNGINIWRDADPDRKGFELRKISLSETQKGDLLFFDGHVAMCTGNNNIIHAAASRGYVWEESLDSNNYLKERLICAATVF